MASLSKLDAKDQVKGSDMRTRPDNADHYMGNHGDSIDRMFAGKH